MLIDGGISIYGLDGLVAEMNTSPTLLWEYGALYTPHMVNYTEESSIKLQCLNSLSITLS